MLPPPPPWPLPLCCCCACSTSEVMKCRCSSSSRLACTCCISMVSRPPSSFSCSGSAARDRAVGATAAALLVWPLSMTSRQLTPLPFGEMAVDDLAAVVLALL
uniref:Sbp1 n=1 Tax=Arundo donax TaxID=35708 RepID=A0A0A9DLG6_ARUDO